MVQPTVHLLIDMVNPLDFDAAERLLPYALAAAQRIAALKRRLREAGVPTVYVNDNFGRWDLGFRDLVDLYRHGAVPGRVLLQYIAPEPEERSVLKPKHSGFYGTSLIVLLAGWSTRRLILSGIAGNVCVLFTAADAYMRDFELVVPADCVASVEEADNRWALQQMARVLKADVQPSDRLELEPRRNPEWREPDGCRPAGATNAAPPAECPS